MAKRYIKRYYIRPQNVFASNKAEILQRLAEVEADGANCSVYSLKALDDHDDVHLLQPKDIIYYYDKGVLYDKNHVPVLDYDLNVKNEEERPRISADATSDERFKDVYQDRMTDRTVAESFDDSYLESDSILTESYYEVENKALVAAIDQCLDFALKIINDVRYNKDGWALSMRKKFKDGEAKEILSKNLKSKIKPTDNTTPKDFNWVAKNSNALTTIILQIKKTYKDITLPAAVAEAESHKKQAEADRLAAELKHRLDRQTAKENRLKELKVEASKQAEKNFKLNGKQDSRYKNIKKDLTKFKISLIPAKWPELDQVWRDIYYACDSASYWSNEETCYYWLYYYKAFANLVADFNSTARSGIAYSAKRMTELTEIEKEEAKQWCLSMIKEIKVSIPTDEDLIDFEGQDSDAIVNKLRKSRERFCNAFGIPETAVAGLAEKETYQAGANIFIKSRPAVKADGSNVENTLSNYKAWRITGSLTFNTKPDFENAPDVIKVFVDNAKRCAIEHTIKNEVDEENVDKRFEMTGKVLISTSFVYDVLHLFDFKNNPDFLIATIKNPFELVFESINAFGVKLTEGTEAEYTCCICGEEFEGYGNNPSPVKETGKCCDACNRKFVIPARLGFDVED